MAELEKTEDPQEDGKAQGEEEVGIKEGEIDGENEEETTGEGEGGEKGKLDTSFMNPNTLPDELKPAFKKMQAAFTKGMQGIASQRDKVKMFDMFSSDPKEAVKMLAAKAGMTVMDGSVKPSGGEKEETETDKYIRKIVREELAPSFESFKKEQAQLKVQTDLAYLDANYPDWYLYEDAMAGLVSKHPTLGRDLDTLYEMAKRADEKGESKQKAAGKTEKVITRGSSGRGGVTTPVKAGSVYEAFQLAKKQSGK